MPTKIRIPEPLDIYLRTASGDKSISIAAYIEGGRPLVTPEALKALRTLGPTLRTRVEALADSPQLKRRVEMLILFLEETAGRSTTDAAVRDVAFALLYFLKGYDRVPDSIPEIGLLDDTIIATTVMQWHQAVLSAHWHQRGRAWPDGL